MTTVSVSLVVYRPDLPLLRATLRSVRLALEAAHDAGALGRAWIDVVDNGTPDERGLDALVAEECGGGAWLAHRVVRGQGNVGYGRGHNLSIHASAATFHLVLNPDVAVDPHAVLEAVRYLEANLDVGMVAPEVTSGLGERQYLCRRYPSVLVLFLRGFAPARLRSRFRRLLDEYEMRDLIQDAEVKGVPLASGCFMFARRAVLQAIGGFSPRYFLYFEDHDLSLALGKRASIAFVPAVRIVHHGGGAARKGLRHVTLYVRSAFTFFRTHGWKLT